MRVIAGLAGGRRLTAPRGRNVRPTTDRVRESLFSGLEARGLVAGAAVADLFAGSGALGIEALSRGAGAAVFVDADARATETIRANLEVTGLAAQATVLQRDALRWCADISAAPPAPGWDLVFADPPYGFDAWDELLAVLPAPRAVLESRDLLELPAGWSDLSVRRYGGTVVTLAVRDAGS